MEKDTGLVVCETNELLDIFVSEDDKKGHDLLKMSNYLSLFVDKLNANLDMKGKWEFVGNVSGFMGEIAAAIKGGFDLSLMNTLIADTSHFSKDIIEGLKNGMYHIGESREVAGNLRPAVLDKNEKLVKFVTLKRALNPTEVLTDISNLSMQISLKQISIQLEDIGRDIQGISEFVRRESLSNKFCYARDRIMLAASANEQQREVYLNDADKYLMEGLESLYADVYAEVEVLKNYKGPFRSLKSIDTTLMHINEDMQMLPRYVGMRVYLFNVRGKFTEAERILSEYRYHLEQFSENRVGDEKYTALELVHKYYPYGKGDTNFWIEQPKQMVTALRLYESVIERTTTELIYIGAEDAIND